MKLSSVLVSFQVFENDEIVIKSIFEQHLVSRLANSGIFQSLVNYLAAHQKEADFLDPGIVMNELLQAKQVTQAKEVDKACKGRQGEINVVLEPDQNSVLKSSLCWKMLKSTIKLYCDLQVLFCNQSC